ncbi:MAG: ESX secretion-associated protein EspG, partial [Sciscionella sp.]
MPVWALSACLRWDNLGEGHPIIAESPVWRSEQADRENDEATRFVLAQRGLFDGSGRLDAGFRDSLIVLARPGVEFSCWAKDTEGSYRALVAAIG